MVYAKYGRTGVYQIRELMKILTEGKKLKKEKPSTIQLQK